MESEFEKQLARIEEMVAAIAQAVRKLHDQRTARDATPEEIKERLRRYLEQKK